MIIETILAAFVPAFVESGKQWVSTKLGGVKATTVDDQIKLDGSEIEKLKAIAQLDSPGGTPSQWVIDLRASTRYIMASCIILGAVCLQFVSQVPPAVQTTSLEAANIVFGFLFGSRIISGIRK